MATLIPPWLQRLRQAALLRAPSAQDNTVHGSRRNISHHYDLSNELFSLFLDPSMIYSVRAVRRRPGRHGRIAAARRAPQDRPACSTPPASPPAPACSRSAPAGASWPSGPPTAARTSPRSRSRPSRPSWPASASRTPDYTEQIEVLAAGLPRGHRHVRRDRQRRDDRGGRRQPLARVLRRSARPARSRRAGRPAGHHHAARPDAGVDEHLHLDPEVHLPRRADRRRCRPWPSRPSWPACGSPATTRSACTTPRRCAAGGPRSRPRPTRSTGLGFDLVFRRMWSLYLAYSEAGFRAATSTSTSSCLAKASRGSMNVRQRTRRLGRCRSTPLFGGELPVADPGLGRLAGRAGRRARC